MEITYLGKLISDIFLTVERGHHPRNWSWNDPMGLVILMMYCSSYLNVDDYKTKNKMHVDIKY